MAAIAVLGAGAGVAAATGPPLGGLLIELSDWRLVFLINVPLGALCLWLGRRVLRESRDPERGGIPDIAGIVLLATGTAGIVLAIVEGQNWGWGSLPTLGSAATGALLVALALRRSARHPRPVIEIALLRIPSVRHANVALLLFATAIYAKILCDVLFLEGVWDFTPQEIGLVLAVGPLTTACCAPLAGIAATRFGARPTAALGALLYGCGCAWVTLAVGPDPNWAAEFLPGSLITGVGNALAFPTLTSAAVEELPAARYATGSALNAAARQLGAVLGVAIAVAILGTVSGSVTMGDTRWGWGFTAFAGAMAALASLTLARKRAAEPEAEPEPEPEPAVAV